MKNKKMKVAILGSGNIGTDLLIKIMRSPHLECTQFVGRNSSSVGIKKARDLGVNISEDGIEYLKNNPDTYDLVFDATSAISHKHHAVVLKSLGKKVIDLTPARLGKMCIPALNITQCVEFENISLITCGAQAAIPIAHAISKVHSNVEYIEVVSSVSSISVGPATRQNIEEYIEVTENAIREFSGCKTSKAILNINPAYPYVDMKTTVLVTIDNPNIDEINEKVLEIVKKVQQYLSGYELLVVPQLENNRLVTIVKISGSGDYLPKYAGNLDIVTCAAVTIAEAIFKNQLKQKSLL